MEELEIGALPRSENRRKIILAITISTVISDIKFFLLRFINRGLLEEKFQ